MVNVVVLHGKPDDFEYYDQNEPSPSNFSWIPWIQKQCIVNEIPAQTPEVFRCFDAKIEDWFRALDESRIDDQTILIGHSCGGGVILRWLTENREIRVKKVILVAPWLDPLKFMRKTFGHELFDFELDPELLERIKNPVIFHSDNDGEAIQRSLQIILDKIPGFPMKTFHEREHFCFPDSVDKAFPELMEEILKSNNS